MNISTPTDFEYELLEMGEFFKCPYDHQCDGCEYDCEEGDEQ